MVEAAEAKVETIYPANSRHRNESMKYLKSLHGLLRMMETPAINLLLAGVEKRPEATLGELMMFMQAYNLRFGPATTPRQRAGLRHALPEARDAPVRGRPRTGQHRPDPGDQARRLRGGEIFSGMSTKDLKRPAPPAPPAPGR